MIGLLCFLLLDFLILTEDVLAVAPDHRISDDHGHTLAVSSTGVITFDLGTDSGTNTSSVAPDHRISDSDGDVLTINSAGQINLTFV